MGNQGQQGLAAALLWRLRLLEDRENPAPHGGKAWSASPRVPPGKMPGVCPPGTGMQEARAAARRQRSAVSRGPSSPLGRRRVWSCPEAGQRSPREKIRPWWVFTPPVAVSIASSACRPRDWAAGNRALSSKSGERAPSRHGFRNQGARTAALSRKVKKSMFWWAPLFHRPTRPGLGMPATPAIWCWQPWLPLL